MSLSDAEIQQLIVTGIKQVLADPNRYGLTWRRVPGTAAAGSNPLSTSVLIDGDTNQIQATSLIGPVGSNTRVMVDLVPPAGAYIIGAFGQSAYRYMQSLHYTADDSFTADDYPGLTGVMVEAVGGGGGSGGTGATLAGQCAASAGGGAGGYGRLWIPASDLLGSSTTVTIGAGGAAGTAGANNGGTGGTTTFATLSCAGGTGGEGGTGGTSTTGIRAVGGVGGLSTGGDLNVQGGDGGFGIRIGAGTASVGFGGASLLGGSTRAGNTGGATPGRLYGGGAGGAYTDASGSTRAGALGAAGIVILHLYA